MKALTPWNQQRTQKEHLHCQTAKLELFALNNSIPITSNKIEESGPGALIIPWLPDGIPDSSRWLANLAGAGSSFSAEHLLKLEHH